MSDMNQRYALVEGGEVFIYLDYRDRSGSWEQSTVTAVFGDHESPMERIEVKPSHSEWFVCAGSDAPRQVRIDYPDRKRTLGYRLADERLADVPRELTKEQYAAMVDEDASTYDPLASRIYEAITEAYSPDPTVIEGWERLDGRARPESDLTWEAKLPHPLRYQFQYLHLFPGVIVEDFRKAVKEELERLREVRYCFVEPGHLDVRVPIGQTTRAVVIRIPHRVDGDTFADALAKRKRLIAEAIGQVRAITSAVCPHCNGSGTTIPAPAAAPKKGRRR